MAQTGFTPIQLYSSSTTGNTPAAADLLNSSGGSELAINIFDGKLFYKDSSGNVQVIGWKVVPVSAGGTGQTSYTDGQLLIGNSTGNTLTKATLTAGTGITITNGSGAITINGTGGTVTSVAASVPAFLSIAGSPITSSGTLAITLSGTALPTTSGGTGLTSFTSGGVVYASSTSALATGTGLQFDGANLGVGVTPSAWNTSYKAIDIGNSLGIIGGSSSADLYYNAFLNSSSQFIYKLTAAASAYSLAGGQHRWYRAPSGTAGSVVTLTQAMTLDTSGNLGVGIASPTGKFHAYTASASNVLGRYQNTVSTVSYGVDSAGTGYFGNSGAYPILFQTNDTERMRVHASGGVSIGNTTDPGATNLSVTGAVALASLFGVSYAQTSTAAGTSIIDTGISIPTGGAVSAAYLAVFSANANVGGNGNYRGNGIYLINISSDFAGGNQVYQIKQTKLSFGPSGPFSIELTLAASSWDGSTDTTTPLWSSASQQLRVKIAGFTGTVGSWLNFKLIKLL